MSFRTARRRLSFLLIFAMAWNLQAEGAGMSLETLKPAVRLIEEEVESGVLGAAALLVAQNGTVVLEEGFGHLSRKAGAKPCRNDSIFLMGSISKPVTATAVMRLVAQGRLKLEDPAQKYLPEFSGDGREKITLRHLLSHTSGLPDMLPDNIALRQRQAPLKDFVAGALRTPLLFPPGTRVSYQSMGTLLASEIVERVSGKPQDLFLREEVFGPLKMRRSSMGIGKRQIESTVLCDLPTQGSMPMKDSDAAWHWNSPYWRKLGAPWGGMHSSVRDIYFLLQAMLDDGQPILPPDLARQMRTNQNVGLDHPWGLGWAVGENTFYGGQSWDVLEKRRVFDKVFDKGTGGAVFGHSGATGMLCWADPERKLVFVLFTDRPLGNHPGHLVRRVAKAVSAAANHQR